MLRISRQRLLRSIVGPFATSMIALFVPTPSHAQQSDAELATKLSNPVESLISVPFQFNLDHDFGPDYNPDKSWGAVK